MNKNGITKRIRANWQCLGAMWLCVAGSALAASSIIELRDGSILHGALDNLPAGRCAITRSSGTTIPINCAELSGVSGTAASFRDGSTLRGSLDGLPEGRCTVRRAGGAAFVLDCAEIIRIDQNALRTYLPDYEVLRVAGSNTIGAKLMPALLLDYVRRRRADHTPEPQVTGTEEMLLLPQPRGPGLWKQIELSAHGSASGFQGLAALAHAATNGGLPATAARPLVAHNTEERLLSAGPGSPDLWRKIEATPADELGLARLANESPDSRASDAPATAITESAALLHPPGGQHEVHIAMSSRRVKAAELSMLSTLGALDHPQSEHVIALDGLAIILNRSNKLDTLSRAQIRDIFMGKVSDWAQLGGSPGPISLYARNDGSGTMDTFSHLVLGGATLPSRVTRIEDSEVLSSAVARDPGGIGFIGMSYVGSNKAANIRECSLIYPPTAFNVKTEEYPLSRRLFLYTPRRTSRAVDDFLAYTESAAAQRIVVSKEFVDLSIESDAEGNQAQLRLATFPDAARRDRNDAAYATLVKKSARLSVTLRFRTNSFSLNQLDLDSRAIHDILRIKEYLRGPTRAGKRIYLVGFTDSVGDMAVNRKLSRSRAASIADELKEFPVAGVLGLGPTFPVGCNDSEEGKARNRRVEIWISP